MKLNLLNSSKFFLLHLLFWVGVWFFYVYFFSYNSTNTQFVTTFSSFLLPVTMITTYFVVYYLIPIYLLTKRYAYFALYSFYTFIFSVYLILMTIIGFFWVMANLDFYDMPVMSRNYVFVLILVYLVVGLVSFVSLLNHNFKNQTKNKELQNKILDAQLQLKNEELKHLKQQLHPHFLFNALNTIYGLSLKKEKNTPEVILKLSELLDYILYQVSKSKVSLIKEFDHLKSYMELENIRFQDSLKIDIRSEGIHENDHIPPMLLIPFVENAFKHGTLLDGYLNVSVMLKNDNGRLDFKVGNTFESLLKDNPDAGIGLQNIEKRMKLLYGERYTITMSTDANWFEAHLIVEDFKNTL